MPRGRRANPNPNAIRTTQSGMTAKHVTPSVPAPPPPAMPGMFQRAPAATVVLAVNVTQEEKEVIRQLAERLNLSMSELALKALGEFVQVHGS